VQGLNLRAWAAPGVAPGGTRRPWRPSRFRIRT